MKRLLILIFSLTLLWSCASQEASAQCAMCKASVEANYKGGGKSARGLNAGILYMLVMPYLLVGTIGYIYWKNKKKQQHDQEEVYPS